MNARTNTAEEITAKVWAIVNGLPQRAAILESDAKAWVGEVVSLHGAAAIWHAIRLNGFGGSEIGVLVRNYLGTRADHQASAHDIVAGKLMRRAPTETSGPMTRGHENEEPHSRRFYAKYGASRDLAAFDALTKAQGKRAWMRYSPDDVVQMPVSLECDASGAYYASVRNSEQKRWLIDYKAPTTVEESDEIAFQYACQLSQGAILCAEVGVELDGMMLSQFDWSNWALKDDVVLWDQSLGELVLDAGTSYWDFVLKGEVPNYIRTEEVAGVEEYARAHLTAAEMYASLTALADASKKRADEIRAQMLKPLAGKRFAGQKISFGFEGSPILKLGAKQMLDREAALKLFTDEQIAACSAKGKQVYDTDALVAHLRSLAVDLKPFRKPDLDAAKVYAMAANIGLDADALVKEQTTMTAADSIKEKMGQYINEHYPLSAAQVQRETEVEVGFEEPQPQPQAAPVS